jgi:hypothetical protein
MNTRARLSALAFAALSCSCGDETVCARHVPPSPVPRAALLRSAGADATVGQGSLFFDALTSEASVHCVSGGTAGGTCDGEEPWPSALPDMVADLAARCTPRHP